MSSERPLSERPAARPTRNLESSAEVSDPSPPPRKGIGCFGCAGIVFLVIVIISLIGTLTGLGGGSETPNEGACVGNILDSDGVIKEECAEIIERVVEIQSE